MVIQDQPSRDGLSRNTFHQKGERQMKATIRPDGSIELDVKTSEDIKALLGAIGQKPEPRPLKLVEPQRNTSRSYRCLAALTKQQTEMYEVLAEMDVPDGVRSDVLGVLLEKTTSAAGQMLQDLIKAGVVQRVSRGHYRISDRMRDDEGQPFSAIRAKDVS
jgi:hypothetical protein